MTPRRSGPAASRTTTRAVDVHTTWLRHKPGEIDKPGIS